MTARLQAKTNKPFTREDWLRYACINLFEAARRRHHPASRDFYWTLLQWVANARRRAAAAPRQHNLPFTEKAQ